VLSREQIAIWKLSNDKIVTYTVFTACLNAQLKFLLPTALRRHGVWKESRSSLERGSEISTKSLMTYRDGDVSMLHFRRRHEASSAPFGIVLAVSLLLQFSGSAEGVASFVQNSVTQEATQNGKTPIVQTEKAGEHQN